MGELLYLCLFISSQSTFFRLQAAKNKAKSLSYQFHHILHLQRAVKQEDWRIFAFSSSFQTEVWSCCCVMVQGRVPLGVSESSSCPAPVVWHHGCSRSLHKIDVTLLMNACFHHLPEPLAADYQDTSPICSDAQGLQRAFPATILTYTVMNGPICSFPESRHRLLRLHHTHSFQKKRSQLKLVLLGHCLEDLNNLKSRNVLNTLGYILSLLTVMASQPSV